MGEAGVIIAINENDIIVTCMSGALKIKTLQPPSKKAMSAVDYIRGRRLEVGNSLV